jgi:succinate dehydrogenase / fumarate reductase cytochrome b subunit
MGWIGAFYATSIGKKIVVAVTGAILLLFLLGHMLGNLQVFAGPGPTPEQTQLNEYAHLLRAEMGLLWTVRLILIAAFLVHVFTTILLYLENRRARPVGYAVRHYRATTVYSRVMLWGGLAVLGYVVYHILHLTTGTIDPDLFDPGDVYGNVIRSFQNPWISGVYILATVALYFHLHHAFVSVFETLGVHHPRHLEWVKRGARVLAVVIVVGFVSVPIGVLLRIVE